ncbi:NPCBM/NEW2 domain-containing protein [Ruminococcus sp. HUN007]|uniref:NPCBM/NEW2 domain-containing protein n=1 Tax=Ruminococcus sp. HUN007 TaxID=1514668 RepID=UPI0005D1C2D8|nr:NPCBM/NEW2 domain-containing protein [Ruminococcus sp. HUN007]
MKNRKIVSGIVALGLALSLTGCGEVNKILEQVDNKDFDAALDIFDSKTLKDKDLDTLAEGLRTRINTYVDSYAKNEITYEELEKLIDFAELLKVNEITSFITDITDDINSLKTSKTNYENAKKSYEENDYMQALEYLGKVIEKDGYYSDAQLMKDKVITSFKDEITSKVDELLGKNDYMGAVSYARSQKDRLGFSEELTSVAEKMESKAVTAMAISKATDYVSKGDIIGALDQIAGVTKNYDIKDKTDLTSYIKTMAMDEVKAASDEENYIYALKILNKADEIIDDDEITKEIKDIEAIKPIYLYDLTCTTKNQFEIVDSGEDLKDSLGNKYKAGNLFTFTSDSGWSSKNVASADYNLGKKYGVMSGTIACQDTSANDAKAIFRIEGDGEVVFEQEVNRKTIPVQFSVDMSKYEWLKLSLSNPEGGECNVILANCKFAKPGEATAETPAVTAAETTEAPAETTAAESEEKAAETEEVTTAGELVEKTEETKAAEETEAAE